MSVRENDQTLYLVICTYESKRYVPERDLADVNYRQIINDIVSGIIEDPITIYAFNPVEGWSNNISEDVAIEVAKRAAAALATAGNPIRDSIRGFCERYCGIGTVLPAAA